MRSWWEIEKEKEWRKKSANALSMAMLHTVLERDRHSLNFNWVNRFEQVNMLVRLRWQIYWHHFWAFFNAIIWTFFRWERIEAIDSSQLIALWAFNWTVKGIKRAIMARAFFTSAIVFAVYISIIVGWVIDRDVSIIRAFDIDECNGKIVRCSFNDNNESHCQ